MKRLADQAAVELVQGDITQQETDAIVNAANNSLLGGGGVDGAIHRAGGPAILEECRRLHGCATGDAKITTGGNLKARYVIHTVGPIYQDGRSGEPDSLASCHWRSLEIADEYGLETIAFPSISTGVYGYPFDEAAEIALRTVKRYLEERNSGVRLVRFVLFNQPVYTAFENAMIQIWES